MTEPFEKVPHGFAHLTWESYQLRQKPHEERPKCRGACYLIIVDITEDRRSWRCLFCLRYANHEIQRSLF
jgi:hypothetical protein